MLKLRGKTKGRSAAGSDLSSCAGNCLSRRRTLYLTEPLEQRLLLATIFSDGFEGAFPGSWTVGNDGGITTAQWGDNSSRAAAGGWSAFAADNGSNSRNVYDNNLHTYMDRRGVSLVGYSTASLSFRYWLNSEATYDFFTVNVRNQSGNWFELFRDSGSDSTLGWQSRTLNLNQFAGQGNLTVQFRFDTDGSVVPAAPSGVWVDEALLTADVSTVGNLNVTARNQNGSIVAGATVVRYTSGWTQLDSKTTNSSGVASWSSVPADTYNLELYSPANNEFWGGGSTNVSQGGTANVTLDRTMPFAYDCRVYNGNTDVTGGSVPLGTQLRFDVSVRNKTTVTHTARASLWLDRDQANPLDYAFTQSAQAIGGNSGTGTFTFYYTPTSTGAISRQLEIQTFINSTYVRTDFWNWGSIVTVTPPPFDAGPRIISQTPSGSMSGSVGHVDVTFNEAISGASFTTGDVSVSSSSQNILVTGVSHVNGNTYRLSFNGYLIGPDTYSVAIGPNVSDLAGNLMNQDNDGTNGEASADRYTGGFTINLTSKYTGIIAADVGSNNRSSIDVFLERVSGQPITPGVQTWVVIHGRQVDTAVGHGASTMQSIATGIDAYRQGDQVLVLDWTQGASDNHDLPLYLDGAGWITHVANWAKSAFAGLSILPSNLYLVGHSWGSFVAYEIAARLGPPVKAIVALDPANGGDNYAQSNVNFSSISTTSWAFYGDGILGSQGLSETAREAFETDYQGSDPSREAQHSAPRFLFDTLVRDGGVHQISSHFSLARLESGGLGPWHPNPGLFEGGFEGRFVIDDGTDSDWGNAWDDVIEFQYVTTWGVLRRVPGSLLTSTPEIAVQGNGLEILDNDASPRLDDHTDFGSVTQGAAATNRTFTVRNIGTATLITSNLTVATGYTVIEGLTASIAPDSSDTFTVRLDTATTGTKSGDVSFGTNDADETPFNFRITGSVTAMPRPDLVPQNVTLSSTSVPRASSVTVNFTVFNAGNADATPTVTRLRLNQSATATSAADVALDDVMTPGIPAGSSVSLSRQVLIPAGSAPGTYYIWVVADNGQALNQSNATNDYTRSPAFTVTGITTAPEVRVVAGASNITSGQLGAVDFGSVTQGSAGAQITFTVWNDGTAPLATSNLTVPAGYTVVESLSSSIAAGQSDTFFVRLDAVATGTKTGQIRFDNNDVDENPFVFPVNGVVTSAPVFWTISASASPPAAGIVSGGGTYNDGTTVSLSASANPGYSFANWTEGASVVSTQPTYVFTAIANRTLVANVAAVPSGEIVLQPGSLDGKDVWVSLLYGGGLDDHQLRVGGWGDWYYSLLGFDLTGMPTSAQSVTLHLYARANLGSSPTGMTLHRVTSAWDEGTKWSNQPSVEQVASLPAPSGAAGWYTIDVTALYNGWQAGTFANHGIQLRPTSNNNNFNEFHSSDFGGDPSLRPKLVVTTAQPPPAAPTVTANDGSGNLTFVRRLTVAFREAGVTAAPGAFVLNRRGGGAVNLTVTPGPAGGPSTFILTFSGPETADGGALVNGVYDLRVVRDHVRDANGQAMAADFTRELFILRGDINGDRSVNGTDFAILAGNFGKTGMTYAQGDLNGDGSVNGSDFALLAGNFGKSLPAATAAAPAPAPAAVVTPAPAPWQEKPRPRREAPKPQPVRADPRVRRVATILDDR